MDTKKTPSPLWGLLYVYVVVQSAWNWHAHPTSSKIVVAIRVGLIVFGTLALLATALMHSPWLRRRQRAAAQGILSMQKALYGDQPHDYAITSLEHFPNLDRRFYQFVLDWAVPQGFRFLGDRENLTITQVFPKSRTCIRTLVNDDGNILLTAWQLPSLREHRTIEFETELADGSFVCTSNTVKTARTLPYPGIVSNRYSANTPPDTLLSLHRQAVHAATGGNTVAACTSLQNLDDCIAFARRMHAIKVVHKKKVGFVGQRDLEMVRGRPLNEIEAGIATELEHLKNVEGIGNQNPL